MLTQTSELAVKAVLFIALQEDERPYSPRLVASSLNCSPSYLAKTANLLVKAGILRSVRGVNGGVLLARAPEDISLLQIVEACQGLVTANYCRDADAVASICSFHAAMKELHESIVGVLSRWTLRDLVECPAKNPTEEVPFCKMFFEGSSDFI